MDQWKDISDSSASWDTKSQQWSELFTRRGIFSCKEGTAYLSSTSVERFAYSSLTTDDMFIAHQFAWWLNNTAKGKAARVSMVASDVVFNNSYSPSLDFTDIANWETPRVKKYKALLYDFIDNSQASIEGAEVLKGIKFFNDTVGKTNSAAKAEADYCIEALNGAYTVGEVEEIVGYLDDKGIYSALDEKDGEKVFSLDKDSGFGKYAKEAGALTGTISVGMSSVNMLKDWLLFDAKLTSYLYYDGFLSEIAEASDLPDDLRRAAELIRREMAEGDMGQLKVAWLKMAENIDSATGSNISSLPSRAFKAGIKAVFGDVASASFSSWLAAEKLSAWAINKLTGVGGVVDGAYMTEGYDLLCTHYRERLEADTERFLAAETEDNAWRFYEDYSMLWQLRLKGEQSYLKMQKVGGITGILRKHQFERFEDAVNESIETVKSCRFVLGEGIEVPESAQFATKFVIDCPVDVDVYAPDGTLVATLADGAESDVPNEHGLFVVTWRAWTGEWAKVVCLSQEGDYRVVARGVGDGSMAMHMAKAGDDRTYAVSNVPVGEGTTLSASVVGMAAGEPCAVDADGDGVAEAEAAVVVADPDAESVAVTGISLSQAELTLTLGESVALVASVEPANATEQGVAWVSSDDDVVTAVGGRVTATGVGEADVVCVSLSDSDVVATCHVVVHGTDIAAAEVEPIEGLVYTGEALEPEPMVTLGGAELVLGMDYELSYASNVDSGTATLIVTGRGSYEGTKEVSFEIAKAEQVVTALDVTMRMGETATIEAAASAGGELSYESGDPSVAVVGTDGVVTPVAVGETVVTVSAAETRNHLAGTTSVKVTVLEPQVVHVTGVSLDRSELVLGAVGAQERLVATAEPADATDKSVAWSSSDESVATVSADGTVTAVASGTATVTATTADGGFAASCTVTVDIPAEPEPAISLEGAVVKVNATGLVYTGSALRPAVSVTLGGKALVAGTDYDAAYADNINAGTATVTITGRGDYTGSRKVTFTIAKAANKLSAKAKAKTVKVKLAKVAKAKVTLKSNVKVTNKGTGKLTYKNASTKKASKKFKVSSKNGKVTIPKGTKKGTYTVKVRVTAAGNANVSAGAKTVTYKVVVK